MILKDKIIVLLGNTRFDSPIKATSLFIARKLAIDNQVFFIDYPFTLKDYYKAKNSKTDQIQQRKEKFSLFSDGLLDTDLPNLKIVITPPVIPINFLPEGPLFRTFLKINEAIISRRLNKIFKKQGIKDFIYINSFNFHYPDIAKNIHPSLTVYHCVDPMIVPYDMKHGQESEDTLVKESDLVICTSKALYLEKKALNPNTYFVPNGTDSVHAEEAENLSRPIHDKISHLPRPIIGYLGTIERRINYTLLEEIAKANPEKSFVLAGPVTSHHMPEELYQIPNVHIVGTIPYEEVPQMINSFDVAIIPFKKDEVSNTIFPIKLFEYLSAGKPVITTDFNEDLKEYTGNCVEYCSDALTFNQAIDNALSTNTAQKIQERMALAKLNTWDERTNQIAQIINEHLVS